MCYKFFFFFFGESNSIDKLQTNVYKPLVYQITYIYRVSAINNLQNNKTGINFQSANIL
jgi:hypothetical protein